MTEHELNRACEWIANMPIEYSEFIEKGHCNWIADDFRKAMEAVIKDSLNPEYDAEYLQSKIDAFSEARKRDGKTSDEMLDDCRGGALELTWQDIQRIIEIADAMVDEDIAERLESPETYCSEILRRFNKEESK